MLTNAFEIKQHEELLADRDILCVQVESGNPFLPNYDYAFSLKEGKKVHDEGICRLVRSREILVEAQALAKENLRGAVARERRLPNNAYMKNSLGLAHLKFGNIEKAIELFKDALHLDTDYFPAKANLARSYSATGELDEALKLYEEMEKNRPNDVRVLVNTGVHLIEKKDFKKAGEYLKKAVKLSPKNAAAWNNLGLVNLSEGRLHEAVAAIRKALRIKGDDPGFHNNLGVCFATQKSFEKAVREFSIAYSLNREPKDIVHNFSQALQEIGEHEKVVQVVEDYLQSHPQEVEFRNTLGWSYIKLGEAKKCVKQLSFALKHTPEEDVEAKARLLNNLGIALQQLGKEKEAEVSFIKSLEFAPEAKLIPFLNLLFLYFRWDDLKNIKSRVDEALSYYPDDSRLMVLLGDWYEKIGEYSKAKEIYENLIAADPGYPGSYLGLSVIEADVYDRPDKSVALLEQPTKEHPENLGLLNNYEYTPLMDVKLETARKVLDKIEEGEDVCLNSTKGLLLIKNGSQEAGKS